MATPSRPDSPSSSASSPSLSSSAHSGSRRRRVVPVVVGGALLLPLVAWLGITLAVKLTVAREAPFGTLLGLVGRGIFGSITCALGGCDAELIDGMTIATFDDRLTAGTLVSLDVDERGRVLLAESHRRDAGAEDNRRHDWLEADLAARTLEDRRAYQRDAVARGAVADADHFTREADRLVVIEDRDGDGRADHRAELGAWNEELSGLIAGVEAREGTIWVANIPSIFRVRDEDADGVAEETTELVRGFGVKTSLGGHDLHGLAWGPDGKLYVSVGDRGYFIEQADGSVLEPALGPGRGAVFRMNSDGSGLEVFATGLRNPQELAFDDEGNLFTGDNNGDGGDPARLVYVVEGGETGWAMPYQSLADDYVRGPWMAERLFDLQHETQPAWILPPVGQIGNGPSGFVHYPGLGLPARYANHFFLCDYAYVYSQSGIWSFALEPRGAGFELVDRHRFIWSVLAPDFDFSWDGRMFAALFDQLGDGRGVAVFEHSESRRDPRVAELARIAQGRMADRETAELVDWLGFPDQRIRLRAQFELARRRAIAPLAARVRAGEGDSIARIHALWGLGQIGAEGLHALAEPTDWLVEAPEALRAQLARVVGDARAREWLPRMRSALADPSPRVRFFAAQALGRLADRESVDPLFALLRENADRDVFLRHAAILALSRIGEDEAIAARAGDPSRAVRLAVLLVWRREGDPRIASFLMDADPLLVVEAARAIYDVPIDAAMPALAERLASLEPAGEDDRQVGQALHRRAIGANVRLRSGAGAAALARYVADERQQESLRSLALEQLARYAEPPTRDLTMGFHRPLAPIDPAIVASVLLAQGRALVDSSLGARALEIAGEYGVSPLSDEELVARVESRTVPADERRAALVALQARLVEAKGGTVSAASRGVKAAAVRRAAESAVADGSTTIRMAGRELLAAIDREAGLAALLAAAEQGADSAERQHAWRRLGAIDDDRVREALGRALMDWRDGRLAESVALDVFVAALGQEAPALVDAARSILAGSNDALVESRRWALAGGDPDSGRRIFQTIGDCQRCHGDPEAPTAQGGHGGRVGPELAGVARKGARFALESVLDPEAEIAAGYARPSAMPPVGLVLEPAALRDLVAYVMTLN